MTVAYESGYTLPSGDLPLNHARIVHDGNRVDVQTVSTTSEQSSYPAVSANAGGTVDRWRPFANLLASPSNLGDTDEWTPSDVTVLSDGQTIDDGTATGAKSISQSVTYTAEEYVLSVDVERSTLRYVVVYLNDGGIKSAEFDLFDDAAVTLTTGGATGRSVRLGKNRYRLIVSATTSAGAGSASVFFRETSGTASYTGANNTVKIERAVLHKSEASITYDLFDAQDCDVFAIAAHNLGTTGATVSFEHDSNDDDTWTALGTLSPTDNSPIMFIFVPITSAKWRVGVSGGVLPEIGVWRVAKALQMERPFYGGFAPTPMARKTEVRGNISGSGELLGRSRKRTVLSASYEWSNLTYAWVRANLDGPDGLIQALETEPAFLAWRPSVTQDVDYIMRGGASAPQASGQRDLFTFSMSGEAYSYE